jgi:hypothetical protein
MPSVVDLLFVTLLFGLTCGALGRLLLRDAGTGWHIRNGQQMLLTHTITRLDSFSATMSGKPWFAWEWLYDLLIAAIYQTLGMNGVVFYSAAMIAVTFVVALYCLLVRGRNLAVSLFLLILALAASAVHVLARPHLLSWLFAVIWFELLDSAAIAPSPSRNRRLFLLPALMVLWVNLHGAFLLGFILLALYLAGFAICYYFAPDARPESAQVLRRLGWVALLCAAASFINPYGYHLHVHVYRYLSDRFLIDRISEFASPNFHSGAQQYFAALLLIAMVTIASSRPRLHPARLLVVLFCVYSGLYATRNLPVAALLLTLIVAPLLSETVASAADNPALPELLRGVCARFDSFGVRMSNFEFQMNGHLWLVAGFMVGLWACAHGGRIGSTQLINAYFEPAHFPVEAVNAIEQQGIHAPIFTLDHWGGYLIYRLYPQNKVFIDDRHDFYGDDFIKDYLKVLLVQPGWEDVLNAEHVDWILMPTDSSLANVLRLYPAWKIEHEDATAAIFHRSGTR